jgi:hypothetical protein
MQAESGPIPNWIWSFAADCWELQDSGATHPDQDAMPIVIQSRSGGEAYVLAKCKANPTGRIYRLVNDQGQIIEEVRHLGRSFGRSAD